MYISSFIDRLPSFHIGFRILVIRIDTEYVELLVFTDYFGLSNYVRFSLENKLLTTRLIAEKTKTFVRKFLITK